MLTVSQNKYTKSIYNDLKNAVKKDSATKNKLETLMCTPGLHALWLLIE